MRRRFVFWLFPVIALSVAVFITVFMIQINPSGSGDEDLPKAAHQGTQPTTKNESWLDRLIFKSEKEDSYPVNDIHLEVALKEGTSGTVPFVLNADINDSYQLFCLKQELKNTKLPYSIIRQEGDKIAFAVDTADKNKLVSLVTKLKTYQITATMSPYTEDQ